MTVDGLLDRQRAIAWLEENVSAKRIRHILGVEAMAADLARIHGVDPERAATAGLLHDLAKFFPPQKLLDYAHRAALEADPTCAQVPHLLHADVGAIVAQQEFGVTDAGILAAIANHTLGNAGMDDLSCIIFLADALEPSRGETKTLQKLRDWSQKDLAKAVWKVCDYTLGDLIQNKRLIHPRMIATRNWALQRAKNQTIIPRFPSRNF